MESIIELCYRKVISSNATGAWEQLVFEDSYHEFKLQAQNFSAGTSYTSYAELLRHIPKTHELTGRILPAVAGYVKQLNNVIPDVLNNIGRRFMHFDNYQFELINSDIEDKARHKIAVVFYSRQLIWHRTINDFLLVSEMAGEAAESKGAFVDTNLFQLQPYINIHSIRPYAI